MKFFKYLLYFLAALILVFLAFGLFIPVIEYGHEVKVDKPVKEAWAVSQDKSKYDQWLAGFKSMELMEGEYFEVGSKYKVVVEPGEGQPAFELIETIVSIKENDHVEMHFEGEAMDMEQIMTFTEADDKTTIRTNSKAMAKGLMGRSMFALMEKLGGAFTSQEAMNMEALKKLIEENTTDYFPAPVEEEEASATAAEVGNS
ncbi:MAG: hypothetical protein KJP00_02800 [Bacteroidia bacterium]|nr:hypothetical protein [Bacteroidia bacterium]